MAIYAGPEIPNSGLILDFDAANIKNHSLNNIEVLVVAGGGGGASRHGGGGGAGGLVLDLNYAVTAGSAVSLTVGVGGAGAAIGGGTSGTAGGNSVFGTITTIGGGGGTSDATAPGGSGGSGGGGRGNTSQSGGAGTSSQGNSGGAGALQDSFNPEGMGGGGGGFRGAGNPGSLPDGNRGVGGNGIFITQFQQFGSGGFFAAGGGAGAAGDVSPFGGAIGGRGGGGQGNVGVAASGGDSSTAGAANTGSGGGAGGHDSGTNYAGKAGGSGVVLIRYRGPQRASGGDSITYLNGYTYHAFTTVGTSSFTPWSAYSNGVAIAGAADLSRTGSLFTTSSAPVFASSNNGYYNFNGSSHFMVCTNGMNSLVGTSAVTFSAWIYRTSAPSYWSGIIANKVNTSEGICLLINPSSKIFFQYDGGVSGVYAIDGGTTLSTGVWYNIVGVYDGTNILSYLNGTVNQTASDPGKSISSSGNMDITIGAQPGPASHFPGYIAKATIYSRALSANEIANQFEAHRGRFGI